jgi:hypothetical protein
MGIKVERQPLEEITGAFDLLAGAGIDKALDVLKARLLPHLKALLSGSHRHLSDSADLDKRIDFFRGILDKRRNDLHNIDYNGLAGILACARLAREIQRNLSINSSPAAMEKFGGEAEECVRLFSHIPVIPESGCLREQAPHAAESRLEKMISALFKGCDSKESSIPKRIIGHLLDPRTKNHPLRKIKLLTAEAANPALYKLEIRLLPRGCGLFYPDPEHMIFAHFDEAFLESLRRAWEVLPEEERPEGFDAVWRLCRLHEASGVREFRGSSAGAGFAVALRHLLTGKPADISCAITGALAPSPPSGPKQEEVIDESSAVPRENRVSGRTSRKWDTVAVGSVGQVSTKVKILLESERRGLTETLIVPRLNEDEARALDINPRRFRIEGAGNLGRVSELLTRGTARKRAAVLYFFTLFLASFMLGVFFEKELCSLVLNPIIFKAIAKDVAFSPDVVICSIRVKDSRFYSEARRAFSKGCTELIRELYENDIRPGAVAVDAGFRYEYPEYDALRGQIEALSGSGVPIILGMKTSESKSPVANITREKFYCGLERLGVRLALIDIKELTSLFAGDQCVVAFPLCESFMDSSGKEMFCRSLAQMAFELKIRSSPPKFNRLQLSFHRGEPVWCPAEENRSRGIVQSHAEENGSVGLVRSSLEVNPSAGLIQSVSEENPWKMLTRDNLVRADPTIGERDIYLLYPLKQGTRFYLLELEPGRDSWQWQGGRAEFSARDPGRIAVFASTAPKDELLRCLNGKLLVVGRELLNLRAETPPEETDLKKSPLGMVPGFYVHAFALSQLMQVDKGSYVKQPDGFAYLLYPLFLFILGSLLGAVFGAAREKICEKYSGGVVTLVTSLAGTAVLILYVLLVIWAGVHFHFLLFFSMALVLITGFFYGLFVARPIWNNYREGVFV